MKLSNWALCCFLFFYPSVALSIPWRTPEGVYHKIPNVRSVADQIGPNYRRKLIAIRTDTSISERVRQERILSLNETTLTGIRNIRRRAYNAHYIRKEHLKTCRAYNSSDDFGTREKKCDGICILAPTPNYFTNKQLIKYYRGRRISDESMRLEPDSEVSQT